MTTNKERREVARKLRELAENPGTLFDVLNAMGVECTFEQVDLDRDRKGINRIADLIEPKPERTCRVVFDEETGNHVCDEYGADYLCMRCATYCPDCGAKVVQNGD